MNEPEHITKTLEMTLKELNEKNSSIQSEPKLPICKICYTKEATISCDPGWQYGRDYCDECHQDQRAKRIIEREIPLKYIDIESDHSRTFPGLKDRNIFLTGKSGTGKTVFACSLAKTHVGDGRSLKFISFPAFIMELQSSFKKDDKNPFEIAEEIAKFSGVLVIDDLGAEKMTDFVKQIIYFIINEREQRCLTTIITSNFSLAQLDEHIDSRISSRIAGMCKVIQLSGRDRRLKPNPTQNALDE